MMISHYETKMAKTGKTEQKSRKGAIKLPIQKKGVSIECTAGTPAQLTKEMVSDKLHNIGLNCEYTTPDAAGKLMNEVCGALEKGRNQSFCILENPDTNALLLCIAGRNQRLTLESFRKCSDSEIAASWTPASTALGYASELTGVIHEASYGWLKQHFIDFAGHEIGPTSRTQRDTTVEAIKDFFGTTLATLAASIVGNLDVNDMKAVCTRMLPPVPEQKDTYRDRNSFLIYLLDNYRPEEGEADGIGVIALDWELTVENYNKNKKQCPKHDSIVTLSTRSAVYDDVKVLEKHFQAVNQITDGLRKMHRLKQNRQMKIYSELPPLTEELLTEGIPLASTENTAKSLILYCTEEKQIKQFDNTDSDRPLQVVFDIFYGMDSKETMVPGTSNGIRISTESGEKSFFSETLLRKHINRMRCCVPAGKTCSVWQRQISWAVVGLDLKTNRFGVLQRGTYGENHFMIKEDEKNE